MTVFPGTRLGPYEILSAIGAGGMGEVYRAKDTRLDRIVAIKVLTSRHSGDTERKQRFEREARTISSLSHPHICALFDLGHQDGVDYLVMEYLEGESMAQRLNKGALPTELVLRYGIEIAEALDTAHRRGIVHRDLKPGNIMLTRSGAKLLDFGLAKYHEPQTSKTASEMDTRDESLTREGVVLGTVQYMAPEQLEGKEADKRSDIFGFGEVLYEMATGERTFKGSSSAQLLTAILSSEPPLISTIAPMAPPALDRVVRKCLAKDPEDRWQDVRDVAGELKWIAEAGSQAEATSPVVKASPVRASRIAWGIAAVAILLLVAALALAAWRMQKRAPEVNWTGMRLGGPEIAMGPRISPDGHTLAFQAMVGENTQVAVMKPDSGDWQVLTHKADAGAILSIAWSADGNRLYYDRFEDVPLGVYSVPVLGGVEQLVVEDAMWPEPLPDGSLLLSKLNADRARQLYRFWPDSGRLQAFPLVLGRFAQFRLFPDGKEAVALARLIGSGDQASHLYAVEIASGRIRRIQTSLSDDSILALSTTPDDASILVAAVSEDLTRLVLVPRTGAGPLRPLLTVTHWVGYMDVASDGSVYADGDEGQNILVRFPADGGRASRIASRVEGWGATLPLADGRIVMQQDVARLPRLVALESGKEPVPIVTTNEETAAPMTAVGTGELAFLIGGKPRRTIAIASLGNGRVTRRIPFDKGPIKSLAASPDGKTIYCSAGGSIWAIPEAGEPRKICAGESVAADPDGKSLLVQVIQTPRTRLLRVPLDGGAPREIALNGPFHLTFDSVNSVEISRDGKLLLVPLASLDNWSYVPGVIDLATGRMTRIKTDQSGDYHSMAWTPDGQVVAGASEVRSTIWKFTPESR
jgi:WD40 repeat protein